MTNKSLLGLVGGGSAAAGLGAGFGVGIKTQPYDYRNYMNAFYSYLIEDAKAKVRAYGVLTDENEKKQILKDYAGYVCSIFKKIPESYNGDSANQRLNGDKDLCNNSIGDTDLENYKSQWETHFKKWDQNLEKERDDFKKYIYDPKPT